MTGSTFAPQTWQDVLAAAVMPNVIGIQNTVSAGSVKTISTLIPDDSLIRGVDFLVKNGNFGDTVSIQIVDVSGIYFPSGTVLSNPVYNWNINTDQQEQESYEAVAPFKILGGLYMNLIYTSTGLLTTVDIEINAILLKCLY